METGFRVNGFFIAKSYDTNNDNKLSTSEISLFCCHNNLKYDAKTGSITSAINEYIEELINDYKLDPEKYSMERLRQLYPDDRYEILNYSNEISVVDKKANREVLFVSIHSNKNTEFIIRDENDETIFNGWYDENGNLQSYTKDGKEYNPVADNIYSAVSAKKGRVIPTTDVNKLVLNIKRITPENIKDIWDYYEQEYGESLYDAINNEWGLDKNIKNKLIEHLNKCIEEGMGESNGPINCKIDENFKQGEIGDCWFLASIAAIQRSLKGQEILNNMITDNKDGSYTVKFRGSDEEYTVYAYELLEKNYARGDLDVRILEIAAEKHFGEIHGDYCERGLKLLLGSEISIFRGFDEYFSETIIAEIKTILKNPNMVMTLNTNYIASENIENSEGEDFIDDIYETHAYAVVDIDNEYIYLQNPHDTSKDIKVPLNKLGEFWANLQYTEIK